MENNKINILIFDIDEVTTTLIENYLKEFDFEYNIKKSPKFDKSLISIDNNTLANFIFVDVSEDSKNILNEISKISKYKKNIFFLMCENPTTDLYVKSLRAGAKEFLKKPIERSLFISAIKNNYKFNDTNVIKGKNRKIAKVITVVSNESSCGKTTFAINISREISEINKNRVLLIDLNDNIYNISFLLDIDSIYDTNYFINETTKENAKEILHNLFNLRNTSLYATSVNMQKQINNNIESDSMENFINIASEYFDYIILDINNTMKDVNKKIFSMSNLIFYIISASINSNVKNKTFIDENLKQKKFNIILNKYKMNDETKIKEVENILGMSLYYKIPLNFGISSYSSFCGKTIRDIKPESEILKVFNKIAEDIVTKA